MPPADRNPLPEASQADCDSLARYCKTQSKENNHAVYCFEIFRRAIVEESESCWDVLYKQYTDLVGSWVSFPITDEFQHKALIVDTFINFWRSYTFEKIDQATGIESILSYLKKTAKTTQLEDIRRNQKHTSQTELSETIAANTNLENTFINQEQAKTLMKNILSLCKDKKEIVIACCSFSLEMKPKEIMERYPKMFEAKQEIYRIKRNLRERIKRAFFKNH